MSKDLHSKIETLQETTSDLSERVGKNTELLEEHSARFDSIDERFDGIDERFDGIDAKFEGIDTQFKAASTRFDEIDMKFVALSQMLNSKFNELFDRLNTHAGDTETRNQEMTMMNNAIGRLEEDVNDRIKPILGLT